MAIYKRGKHGYYHANFRGLDERPDGSLVMVHREINLHTTDAVQARALDFQLRDREAKHRAELRARAFARNLIQSGNAPVSAPVATREHVRKRLRLADALDAAERYAKVSPTVAKIWRRFIGTIDARFMDEVTPELIHAYLSGYERGKTYNNVRSAIGRVFGLTRMESGVTASPVDPIPTRRTESNHQRPITEAEFLRLYAAANDPWKTAFLIAWHTGLRQNDVVSLRWNRLDATDAPIIKPGKTARFNRSVQIPIHPQLATALAKLPHVNEYVLGAWWPTGQLTSTDRKDLAALFARCGVASNESGLVKFNSFRDSFISRLDAAGIPRHAIRGMVGHVSDEMTDLYSHDLTTARLIQGLPAPPLPAD